MVFLRLVFLAGVTGDLKLGASRDSTDSPFGVELADSGLGGWLPSLLACFGGWGKAPMLTVLRRDLPGGSGPAGESVVVRVGTLEAEFVWVFCMGRCGRADDETALLAAVVLLGRAGSSEPGDERAAGVIFETRDFATGSEGSGPVGGAMEGRDGRGRVWLAIAATVYWVVGYAIAQLCRLDPGCVGLPMAHSYPALLLLLSSGDASSVRVWGTGSRAARCDGEVFGRRRWCHPGGEEAGR